jgi:hypothetical protein
MRNFASTSSLVGIAVIGSFLASIIARYPSPKERGVDVYIVDGYTVHIVYTVDKLLSFQRIVEQLDFSSCSERLRDWTAAPSRKPVSVS